MKFPATIYSGLSDAEQGDLCRESVHKAAALFSVRAESLRTGFEQLMFCFGDEDSDNWSQSTGSLISQGRARDGIRVPSHSFWRADMPLKYK